MSSAPFRALFRSRPVLPTTLTPRTESLCQYRATAYLRYKYYKPFHLRPLSYTRQINMSAVPFNTDKAPKPVAAYSQAVKAGGFLYVSGQVPLKPDGSKHEGSLQEQTVQVLENLKNIIVEAGSSWDKIVKVTIYVTDMGKFGEINEVYAKYFDQHRAARTTIGVAALPLGFQVEMDAVVLE
ncbi:Endoribonuclease L-PSP/chorismate mutase-like protein [Yarrowia lipolytica]|uniref:YALI0C09735p n=1 Tax=Yarrowia lipolytica (strain CLIB 122 / E 150) TaxID=284591 RepID=Q6CCF9_YARLI|nr:YALI0C09735p [Yarrowia lipolytica CLIB122]RDW43667.1 Endoribonuclease L-PSP/chorismate mutase-like protein [Yarrowia lipolytica]RDW53497.1 Endoribonuclease L-PSP/chorismate mutase-like protein [Yarrowia lipolytica]CAG81960.2 YALI0C09735p [Yarrowia lipolytica CLIB122]|eukprot:XP_501653.2 YALI0C09735p [Yarrowia lipolytica CLIB122]